MIYISQSNSKQSLDNFLEWYSILTSGEFVGIGIVQQMENHFKKTEWCSKNCPVNIGSKAFKRNMEIAPKIKEYKAIQFQKEWEKMLKTND